MQVSASMFSRIYSVRRHQHGLTLVELMVALLIGLIGSLVIFQVFATSETYKRTTVAAGNAQTNGSVGLYLIERYIRTAGSSITTTNQVAPAGALAGTLLPNWLIGCPLSGLPAAVPGIPGGVPAMPVSPVRIIDGGAGASDSLVIMAGNNDIATSPTPAGPIAGGSIVLNAVSNMVGLRPPVAPRLGDLLLVTDRPTVPTNTISPVACSMRRIAAASTPTGSGFITLGLPMPAINYGRPNLHNMGPNPYFLMLTVNANRQLVEVDFTPVLSGEGAAVIRVVAEGVINIQAQYGVDDDQDDRIDRWVEPTGPWAAAALTGVDRPGVPSAAPAATINKIKAIRVGVMARSNQYESSPTKSGDCQATRVTAPLQAALPNGGFVLPPVPAAGGAGGAVAMPSSPPNAGDIVPVLSAAAPSTTVGNDWHCFRYRSYESIVQIRNMMWSPL